MSRVLVEVTDLVEFLQRRESVSGVQRVIAETVPLLDEGTPIVLDRGRGVFVALTPAERAALIDRGARLPDRAVTAQAATACLARARTAAPVDTGAGTVILFLGAVWINDALMIAARSAHAAGARCVYLLYDLTPVLEAGHTAAVNQLFDRYLRLITQTGSAVPAISRSSRADYEEHCRREGATAPPGEATGLPCGLGPDALPPDAGDAPWPRPYALFVGTVEARKNHLLALRAWQRLVDAGHEVPDLVCVGRLGWNANTFLREYVETGGLGGRVSVLSGGVSDADLARFYAHCLFTVYPSRYEGWGLPVSESLAFGKVPIVTRTSSLPEAGGDLAVYVPPDDADALADAIVAFGLDDRARAERETLIRTRPLPAITWERVARILDETARWAGEQEGRPVVFPPVELGREYLLGVVPPAPDGGHADQYLAHLQGEARTPLLGQSVAMRDHAVVDAAVTGEVGSPQTWGYEARPGRRLDIRLTRPADGPLVVLLATRSMPGVAVVEAAGPGGPVRQEVYLGSVLTLPVGEGRAGEPAQVSLTVVDATDSVEGFLGIRSFVVLAADDLTTRVVALEAAAAALRGEIDFMTGTRSWRVTAPLRRWKGRGAS